MVPVPTQKKEVTPAELHSQRQYDEHVSTANENYAQKLSTIFGGKVPPKHGVGPKPNVRMEKADVLAQINEEIKRFDSEEIQVKLDHEVDQTVLKIQKGQKQTI